MRLLMRSRSGTEVKALKVLYCKPDEKTEVIDIPCELKAMQDLVEGYIECVYPFDDPVALVCNSEGKLNASAPNRYIPGDLIFGPFFLVGLGDEDFVDFPEELIDEYISKFDKASAYA